MAKKITIDIEVNGKMQKATVSAKKLRESLDKVDTSSKKTSKSTGELDRNYKGVAGTSANVTKNFSKMSQGMGGVVRAYATLAANAFAVGAAFNALQRNRALAQLEDGLGAVGRAAGTNLPFVSEQLRDITDNALSAEQAMRATAQASSAGFDAGQLQRLASVAKGASLALGRNLPDALDRLVRGTAKVEPEILDELGIFVRLDDAAEEYAQRMGKTANQLTQFERSQAFLNATLEQGEKKFALVASKVDVNPYDQLIASVNNLKENFLDIVNVVAVPFVKFVSDSKIALAGLFALFASTISGAFVDSIQDTAAASVKAADDAFEKLEAIQKEGVQQFKQAAKDLEASSEIAPKGFKDQLPVLTDPKADPAKFAEASEKAQTSLNRSMGQTKRRTKEVRGEIAALKDQQDKTAKAAIAGYKKELRELKKKEQQIEALQSDVKSLEALQTAASQKNVAFTAAEKNAKLAAAEAEALSRISDAGLGAGYGIGEALKTSKDFFKNADGWKGKLDALGRGFTLLRTVALRFLPIIGVAAVAFGGLVKIFEHFTKKTAVEQKIDEIKNSFADLAEVSADYQIAMELANTANEEFAASLNVMAGVLGQLKSAFQSIQQVQMEQMIKKVTEATKVAIDANKTLNATPGGVGGIGTGAMAGMRASNRSSAADRLAEAEQNILEAKEKGVGFDEASARGVIAAYSAIVKADPALKKLIPDDRLQDLEKLPAKGYETMAEFNVELAKIIDPILNANAAYKNLNNTLSTINKAQINLFKQQDTAFTASITGITALENELKTITDSNLSVAFQDLEPNVQKAVQAMAGANNTISKTALVGEEVSTIITKYKQKFIDADKEAREIQNTLKKQREELKELNTLRKDAGELEALVLAQEEKIRQTQLNSISIREEIANLLADEQQKKAALAQLDVERAVLEAQQVQEHEKRFRLFQGQMDVRKQGMDMAKKELDISKRELAVLERKLETERERTLREQRTGSAFGNLGEDRRRAQMEYDDALLLDKVRREQIEAEGAAKAAMAEVEYALLDAKYLYLESELKARADTAKTAKEATALNAAASRLAALRGRIGVSTNEETGEISATKGGLLERTQNVIIEETNQALNEQEAKLEELEERWKNSQTWFAGINAGKETLANGLGRALEDVIRGTKNAKDAFAELAVSVLDSISKIMMDRMVEDFLNFLFPPKGTTTTARPTIATGTSSSPSSTTSASGVATGAVGSLFSGLMGKGSGVGSEIGHSPSNPLYVCCVKCGEDAGVMGSKDDIIDKVLNKKKDTDSVKEGMDEKKTGFWDALIGKKRGQKGTQEFGSGDVLNEDVTIGTSGSGLKGLFDDFTGDMGAIFSGESPFLSGMGDMFTNLFGNLGGVFDTLLGGLFGQGGGGIMSLFGFRNGGIMNNGSKVSGYATGGIADGPNSGHLAMLHGREAVVPLPNGNSIPVQMNGSGGMQNNNVTVNVSTDGQVQSSSNGAMGENLGQVIAAAVQKELHNQKRAGGILNKHGAA
jgi:hypothetical protein